VRVSENDVEMVSKLIKDKEILYKCDACGLLYRAKEIAEKCQAWCDIYGT
jgi:uncharacterized Zn finger protein